MARNANSEALHGFERDRNADMGITERRNMLNGVVHGAFFHMASAFADPYVIVPLFLSGFTKSRVLIGLVVSLAEAAAILPQVAVASRLRAHPDSARPLMLVGIWSRCAVWGALAVLALVTPNPSIWALLLFAAGLMIYALGGGLAVLPFKHVITETIEPTHRSTFFGLRLIIGGILAMIAGLLVRTILGTEALAWPQNYAVLFFLSFASLALAYMAMSRFRFPSVAIPKLPAKSSIVHEIGRVLSDYPILKRLVIVRLFSGGLGLVLPFLTLYATRDLGVPLVWVGVFVAAQKAGAIVSNLSWMPLGNRVGTKAVILSGLVLAVLSLTLIAFAASAHVLTVAFAIAGASMSAMIVGFNGYILELGTPDIRPFLFAVEGTLLAPLYFMPVVGGWIADTLGFSVLIFAGMAVLLISVAAATTLCEPRQHGAACGPPYAHFKP